MHVGSRCSDHGAVGPPDVFVASVVGTEVRALTESPAILGYDLLPSPADPLVAFVFFFQRDGSLQYEVHVVDADTSETRYGLVSGFDLHIHVGAWSPDGRYLRLHGPGGHGICG